MSSEELKVAVIGAGSWGYQHARAFHARKDTRLVSVAGRSEARTRARAEEFSARWYTDVEKMLRQEKPDFVSVCLPAQHHFEPTMQVIEEGIPLLAEKPLAYDLKEAQALIERAAKKQLFFAIDFNQRYSIPCLKAAEDIRSGRLGTPVYALWRFGHGWDAPFLDHPYLNLIEAQCHGLDLLEHLMGPITSVSAEMTDVSGRQSFSSFSLALGFANKAVGSFLATLDANEHNRLSQLAEFGGTKGRILIEDNVQRYTFQENGSSMAESWQAGFFEDDLRSFGHNLDRHLDELIPALLQGRKPPVPASCGLRALRLAYAAIESFQTGRRISCPPEDFSH